MAGCRHRVEAAFAHREPDRTPLFEIFAPFHPVHWEVCGRTIATDAAIHWDALADGVAREELLEATAQAAFSVARHFGLDMVRLPGTPPRRLARPQKTGEHSWRLNGVDYALDANTCLVKLAHPGAEDAYSHRFSEADTLRELEAWDGSPPPAAEPPGQTVLGRVQELAAQHELDWVFMGEVGAGTGAAFYPPFLLIWMVEKPDLFRLWLEKQKVTAFQRTREQIAAGCRVIAIGGDVSCDKGPFISPHHYRQFLLPVIQEHVALIHQLGALAVYTSDGNHWPIRDEFFLQSGVDGYKEVDYAAGMTMDRLVAEGIKDRICIIGNIDARHLLCHGTPDQVRAQVFECLSLGRQTPGGHILHASHSVHEDVKPENYRAMVNAYREFFGLTPLPG